MRTCHLLLVPGSQGNHLCCALSLALLCLLFAFGAIETVKALGWDHEACPDVHRTDYQLESIPTRSRWSEPDLPIDTLELIPIAWAGFSAGHAGLVVGDSDQDGFWELMASRGDAFRIYENDGYDNYSLEHTGPYFKPWDGGDADGDGLSDVIGQSSYWAQLWESPTSHSHPSELVWQSPSISNIYHHSRIVDLDQDGNHEIILTRNGRVAVIVIFECTGDNSFDYVCCLHAGGLELGEFAVGDFDQDGWMELAVGDMSGHVFVFECTGDNSYHQVATLSTGVEFCYYGTEAHDMDGNNRWEFVMGSSAPGIGNKWTVFEAVANNTYIVVDSMKIGGSSGSARCAAGDIDSDGTEELVVSGGMDLDVYKAIDIGTYVPVAHYVEPPGNVLGCVRVHDLNWNGYDEIVWAGVGGQDSTLLLEDRRAYGEFTLHLVLLGTTVPQGGTFTFGGGLVNLEATPETVDVWTEVVLPGGEPYEGNPVLGPERVIMAPYDTLFAHPSHRICMTAPLGEYTYMGYVSSSYPLPILAADTLYFTVVPP